VNYLIKHKDVVNYLPILQKLEVVYATGDGKGGFYKQPAIALAVIRDEEASGVTYLAPMVSINAEKEIDIAHESNIIGYDDGSQHIDWKKMAEKYEANLKKKP
jgi:hypothetical protein